MSLHLGVEVALVRAVLVAGYRLQLRNGVEVSCNISLHIWF